MNDELKLAIERMDGVMGYDSSLNGLAWDRIKAALAAPSVPDAIQLEAAEIIGWGEQYARGWNACRAAMLSAAPSPPVRAQAATVVVDPAGGNFYHAHPLQIDGGTFWRCKHGVTGLNRDLTYKGCPGCAAEDPAAYARWHASDHSAQPAVGEDPEPVAYVTADALVAVQRMPAGVHAVLCQTQGAVCTVPLYTHPAPPARVTVDEAMVERALNERAKDDEDGSYFSSIRGVLSSFGVTDSDANALMRAALLAALGENANG